MARVTTLAVYGSSRGNILGDDIGEFVKEFSLTDNISRPLDDPIDRRPDSEIWDPREEYQGIYTP